MVRNIFQNASTKDEATLFSAAQMAGGLLIAGAKQAEISPRFFQSVGRAIVLADQTTNGGKNRQAISDAFSRHGILLGTMAALMPKASLAGPAPRVSGKARALSLSPETVKDIRKRIEAPAGAKFSFQAITLGGEKVVQAVHYREVRLDKDSKALKGVVAYAPEPVVVGGVQKLAAVFNILPDPSTTEDEVGAFVETLLSNDEISLGSKKAVGKRFVDTSSSRADFLKYPTHVVRVRQGKKVLTRVRYAC
jgi:hypothetical protein